MQTLNITECLKEFIDFLKASKSRVVLAAHNGRVFDSRILVKALFKENLSDAFQSVVMGFLDTLPLFKKLLPGRQSYKQESLVKDCLNKSYDVHNSLEDVKSLRNLLLYHNPSCSSLSVHSFTVGFVSLSLEHYERETVNLPSLNPWLQIRFWQMQWPNELQVQVWISIKYDLFMQGEDMMVFTVF